VSSLHRAVVLRSAQRVHLERERYIARQQYEDEQEEEEVLQAVSPERELGPFELEHKEASDRDEDERGENDEIDQDEPVVSVLFFVGLLSLIYSKGFKSSYTAGASQRSESWFEPRQEINLCST